MDVTPDRDIFAVLCFEGPDRYALAGGLGTRISGLSQSLAEAGFETHLYFIGDPDLPGAEVAGGGRLHLHRWCQWISRYHPGGVYDGERGKVADYRRSVPVDLLRRVAQPAAAAGRRLFLLAEDWQTTDALAGASDLLHQAGLRAGATLVWNANNPMGFHEVNWGRLAFVATLTTVSRYMKHYMWGLGQNPIVIPNGIPEEALEPPAADEVRLLRGALRGGGAGPALVKVARWDPDKRWLMAVSATAALRARGRAARLICKGGVEPHGGEVLERARREGLVTAELAVPEGADVERLCGALESVRGAALVSLRGFLAPRVLQTLYGAADAVLANSGMEPFGLAGLEAMAAGGLVFVGATGEDYARPFRNAVCLETDDPREIVHAWETLEDPDRERLRRLARETAAEYTWPEVLRVLCRRLDYLASCAPR